MWRVFARVAVFLLNHVTLPLLLLLLLFIHTYLIYVIKETLPALVRDLLTFSSKVIKSCIIVEKKISI
jgi:hypothetical protein